jgi:hypothetical protein
MPLTVLSGNPTGSFEESQDSAFKVGNPEIYNIPAPLSLSGSSAITAQQLINGIISCVSASAVTLTFPTATALAAMLRAYSSRGIVNGDAIYVLIVNGGSSLGAITITPGAGMTFDAGSPATIAIGVSRTLLMRFTVGTPGSETAVLF